MLSSVDEGSSLEASTKKNIPFVSSKKLSNMKTIIRNNAISHKPVMIKRKARKIKLSRNQIRLRNNMISTKLKQDISRSKLLKIILLQF